MLIEWLIDSLFFSLLSFSITSPPPALPTLFFLHPPLQLSVLLHIQAPDTQ